MYLPIFDLFIEKMCKIPLSISFFKVEHTLHLDIVTGRKLSESMNLTSDIGSTSYKILLQFLMTLVW